MNTKNRKLSSFISRTLIALGLAVGGCATNVGPEPTEGEDFDATENAISLSKHSFGIMSSSGTASSAYNFYRGYKLSTGRYQLWLPYTESFPTDFGVLEVTALGTNNNRCKVEYLTYDFGEVAPYGAGGTGSKQFFAVVRCHDLSNVNRDNSFAFNWVRADGSPGYGKGGYAYVSGGASPTISSNYNTARGAANSVARTSTGAYTVRFPGIAMSGGTVAVTAAGTDAAHCKVAGWGPSGADQLAYVRCMSGGSMRDSGFLINVDERVTSTEAGGAHVWAHDPSTQSYAPSATWTYNSSTIPGGTVYGHTAGRLGLGRYFVMHRAQTRSGARSTAHVTAYGASTDYCKLEAISGVGSDVYVYSNCFNSSGTPVDTQFAESYSRTGAPTVL